MVDFGKINGKWFTAIAKISGVAKDQLSELDGSVSPGISIVHDWDDSLWKDDNLSDNLGAWNYASYQRRQGDQSTAWCGSPFIDDSGETKSLKLVWNGESNSNSWGQIMNIADGTRILVNNSVNPDICMKSDTGIEFDGSNMVDGTHGMQFQWMKIGGKGGSNTYYSATVFLTVTGNVIQSGHRINDTGTNSTPNYFSYVDAIASPTELEWELTFIPSTNTWSRTGGLAGKWTNTNSNVTTGVDFGGAGISKAHNTHYMTADSNDHYMWWFKTS